MEKEKVILISNNVEIMKKRKESVFALKLLDYILIISDATMNILSSFSTDFVRLCVLCRIGRLFSYLPKINLELLRSLKSF